MNKRKYDFHLRKVVLSALYAVIWLIMYFTIMCCTIISVNASSLLVKNAWISGASVLTLTENGDLYFGESIDSQNKKILLSNVKDAYVRSGNCVFSLLTSGDVVRIDVEYLSHGDWKIEDNITYFKDLKATKLLKEYRTNYLDKRMYIINDKNELVYLHGYGDDGFAEKICNNVKTAYYDCVSDEIFIIINDNQLMTHTNDGLTPLLDNVTLVNANGKACALTQTNDLFYINYVSKNQYLPTRIATNVKTILDSYNQYIPYIDNENNLYVYNCENYTTELVMKNAKTGFFSSPYYYIIGTDNNLYINKTSKYSNDYNPTIIHQNIKEIVFSLDQRLFFTSTNDELYMGYTPHANPQKLVISPTGLNNISSVHAWQDGSVGYDDYIFVAKSGCVYGTEYYGTENNGFIHTIYCDKKLKLLFNGNEVSLILKVQNINDRTMYPFRECLENFGATVLWDGVNNSAIGKLNGRTVEFPIGKQEYYVNNIKYEMDATTYIDNTLGRTYIPIRYAAEGLGFKVDWDEGEKENTISIYK